MSVASRMPSLPSLIVSAVVIAGVGLMAWKFMGTASSSQVTVKVPALSAMATRGEVSFTQACASCHGVNASGTDLGPPLVHDIYNPGHHGDGSFFAAGQRGVRAHHWPFGNMPAQPQIKQAEMTNIIRYVRELQIANGIVFKQHKM